MGRISPAVAILLSAVLEGACTGEPPCKPHPYVEISVAEAFRGETVTVTGDCRPPLCVTPDGQGCAHWRSEMITTDARGRCTFRVAGRMYEVPAGEGCGGAARGGMLIVN